MDVGSVVAACSPGNSFGLGVLAVRVLVAVRERDAAVAEADRRA